MSEQSSELPLLDLDSVLPASDIWLRWSTALLISSIGLLTGLSAGFTVDQTVRSAGVIRPRDPYAVVTLPTAGTLKTLTVAENDRVRANQVVGELQTDNTVTPLIAPQDGIIFQLSSDLVGNGLSAGTPITYIAPLHPQLTLRLQVDTQDIAQLAVGQTVQARVSAYPYPDYGTLQGTIETIAPDVTPCSTCATPYGYIVNVAIPTRHLKRQERYYPLSPGMDVTADIVTQRTRVLSVLLQKLRIATDM